MLGEARPGGAQSQGSPKMPLKAARWERSRAILCRVTGELQESCKSKHHRAFGGDTVKGQSFWLKSSPVSQADLSKCKLPPPPDKGSNWRWTWGSSLFPCFLRSGFAGRKYRVVWRSSITAAVLWPLYGEWSSQIYLVLTFCQFCEYAFVHVHASTR